MTPPQPSDRATTAAAPTALSLGHVIDRTYREMVQGRAREDWMRHLCQGLAQALDLVLVLLVQRHAGGTLEVEATSRESALWAELRRLPERSDGTIVGDGAAARALHAGGARTLLLDDEGMRPWRQAAASDGIGALCAVPLEAGEGPWLLVGCAAQADAPGLAQLPAAAAACLRLLHGAGRVGHQALLAAALEAAGTPAFIADVEGQIVWCNRALCELTGYAAEELRGRNPRMLGSGRHGVRYYRDLWNTIRGGHVWRGETVDRDRAGTAFSALQTITPFGTADRVTHYLAVYHDITGRKGEETRRAMRMGRDPVTGLASGPVLEARLAEALEHGSSVRIARVATRRPSALEDRGGESMEQLAGEVQDCIARIAGAECAARLGPGDYLVQLPDDAASASRMVDRLVAALARLRPSKGTVSALDLHVGVAAAPQDGAELDALLRAAERALGAEPLAPARRRLPAAADPPPRTSRP